MNFVDTLCVEWYRLWRDDYVGMVIAIICTQEILNYALKLLSLARGHARPPRTWQAFLLHVDFALEYPAVFIHLPCMPQSPPRGISTSIPGPLDLLFQISVLIIIEKICSLCVPNYGPSQGQREFAAAAALSAGFVIPRLTLLFGIPVLESMLPGKFLSRELHFASVIGWLMCRRLLGARRV